MDTSWWLALAAVVLLALVASLIDGWGRGRRPRGRRRLRPPGLPGARDARAPGGRPSPGDIWWANVPFEDRAEARGAARAASAGAVGDGPGKDRPCLVLAVRGDRATVARITSKFHDDRAGVIPLPPGAVGDARGRPSFLHTDELREVPVGDFRRRVGVVDPVLWDQVRHLAR
ncbi:type II toxin-antitoxin system PemK/MazF family toxin [Streptomyces sp. NEAU-sy36]|uniref:type II toxin-antitoxin system PemK/MazF family toxin n=1 Tax=unclassified Streptomyces TaxID=2593676 RepID=UPI0015D64354|nr:MULTISPECIES: type II toxin-antitoxin system PemK/MazF family toxin [unclassified Streptomyces]QLJ00162.1 type II toxin-antitoxin system PemK/MazF family toxin [Streptomyces sp. NEAU-sy36]